MSQHIQSRGIQYNALLRDWLASCLIAFRHSFYASAGKDFGFHMDSTNSEGMNSAESETTDPTGPDDSRTLPAVVSDDVKSLTDNALFDKLQELGYKVGPVVESTRSLYEKKLQQLLNNGTVRAAPTDEFSSAEEEEKEPVVLVEDSSDEEDGGTPLQKASYFPESPHQNVRSNVSNSSYSSVKETVQPSHRSVSYSTRRSSSQAGSPVQMTLRSRASGARGEDVAGNSNAGGSTPDTGKQRPMSRAVKVLIALAVITVNVLIYANLEYFKGSESATPVPSVLD